MPLYTADALILRCYKLGESDRIVVFLTRDRGKKRGVARNARQSRRRFGGALEPLTCGRVAYMERERRDLVRVDYVEPTRSPLSAVDGEALGYVGYFAELIDEWAQEADPNEPLFRLGTSMVEATNCRARTVRPSRSAMPLARPPSITMRSIATCGAKVPPAATKVSIRPRARLNDPPWQSW